MKGKDLAHTKNKQEYTISGEFSRLVRSFLPSLPLRGHPLPPMSSLSLNPHSPLRTGWSIPWCHNIESFSKRCWFSVQTGKLSVSDMCRNDAVEHWGIRACGEGGGRKLVEMRMKRNSGRNTSLQSTLPHTHTHTHDVFFFPPARSSLILWTFFFCMVNIENNFPSSGWGAARFMLPSELCSTLTKHKDLVEVTCYWLVVLFCLEI